MIPRLIICLMIVMFSASSQAELLHVPDDYQTIQEAIDASEDGDTLLVQPGTYVENINFEGKEITVASLILTTGDDAYIDSTVIDGDASGHSVVVFRNGEGQGALLTGFTIRNGDTDYGGGVYIRGASPTLSHLLVADNSVTGSGGGIYCTQSASPTVTGVVIVNNSANNGGGISSFEESSPDLSDVVITGNNASTSGGGIQCRGGGISINSGIISDNSTVTFGGGVYVSEGGLNLTYCLVCENSAENYGGGIYVRDSEARLSNVTIAANSSDVGGGICCVNNGRPVLVNAILWNEPHHEIEFRGDEAANTVTISYCDIEGGLDGVLTNYNGEVIWGEGNIDQHPLFADIEEGDFQLTINSPCIDAGDPESGPDPDETRADMGTFPFLHRGLLQGYVLDMDGDSPLGSAVITTSYGVGVVTDTSGFWAIPYARAGVFDLTASLEGYNDSTLTALCLEDLDTLEFTFRLLHPEFLSTVERLGAELQVGDSTELDFGISNHGNGPVTWTHEKRLPDSAHVDPWTLRHTLQTGREVDDARLEGVVFADDHFFVTGSNISGRNDTTNLVYVLERDGSPVDSFEQVGQARHGMKDLAWDGELIWGSGEQQVYGFTTEGELVVSWVGPFDSNQALAWDNDRKVLWVTAITGNYITGFARDGMVTTFISRHGFRIYGLAYWPEDPDGYPLYVYHSPTGLTHFVHKIDPDEDDTLFVGQLELEGMGRPSAAFITRQFDAYSWVFVTLVNDGLNDHIDIWQLAGNTAWMSIAPQEGVIPPGGIQDFTMEINATELLPGPYEGVLAFIHNAAGGETWIDVALTVLPLDVPSGRQALLPVEFGITSIHPNPFNATTVIRYGLNRPTSAQLKIYDLTGREVVMLVEGRIDAGYHSITWNPAELSSGVYIVRLITPDATHTRKMALVR